MWLWQSPDQSAEQPECEQLTEQLDQSDLKLREATAQLVEQAAAHELAETQLQDANAQVWTPVITTAATTATAAAVATTVAVHRQ